ncbi:SWIM zinc finger family protein [Bacillus massilinigeriensis]|uniref:SWIM zinc finger family protein n=1 Tax=Bacillus mediterraneensis TaxID=1805474 RepID=UPI0008F8F206|nr:hypothetical protein [Bacillus mediterraneensis]
MNINNFEKYVSKTILDRGYDYYMAGNVVDTYSEGDNEYFFDVEGSEDYEVEVKLDNKGEIIYSDCDCPYDLGPICKHEVAAFFELLEIIGGKHNELAVKEEAVHQPSIKEVLNALSREELIDIMLDLTQSDKTLKNSLILRYSKGNVTQELERCKRLIDSIVNKYISRKGYIEYGDTYDFVWELDDVLVKARNTDDILSALDIAFLLLIEAVEAYQYADDSGGAIGSLVSETIETIGEKVAESANLDSNLREKVFHKLLEQSEHKVFDGWDDYRVDLLRLCLEFADVEGLRNELKVKIENSVSKNLEKDSYTARYYQESMLRIVLEIINIYGTDEEAVAFIKQNLQYSSFRELLLDKLMKGGNYQNVIELAEEGEKQDKEYAGLVLKWKEIKYQAYKKLSLTEEQRKLAKELLFDGNFEYYKELLELNEGNKTEFYQSIKQELKEDKGLRSQRVYLKLIEQEQDLDEIMEFVRENPRSIEDYARMLQEMFKDEVIEVYKRYIKGVASSSSNRKAYQGVCGVIKRYGRIAGKQNQAEIIHELTILYKKRPAFVDELSKIK